MVRWNRQEEQGDYGQEAEEQYMQQVLDSPDNVEATSTTTNLHPTIVHEQLENDRLIQNIELRLKGIRWNALTKKYDRTGSALVAKEMGVEKILAIIQSHLDKVQNISDLDDQEIYNHMLDLYTEVVLFVYFDGFQLYGIQKGDLPIVTRIICTPIFTNLKRARGGRQLDAISMMQKLVQSVGDDKPKKGILNRIGLKF